MVSNDLGIQAQGQAWSVSPLCTVTLEVPVTLMFRGVYKEVWGLNITSGGFLLNGASNRH